MEQSLYELPEGWVWSNIGKAGVVTTGNTPPKKNVEFYTAEGGRPFVKPPQLGLTHPITDTPEQLSELGFRKSKPVEKGSILVCCIGSIGKVGVAGTRLATNQQINSITFGDCVDWRWGYYFALTLESIMNSMANSAVVSIINKSTFSKIPIPIPPLREQKRIVAKLDALFTRIDAAITHLQETLELSKAVFASSLEKSVFPEAIPPEWIKGEFGNFATFSQGIQVPVGEQSPTQEINMVRFLRISDFVRNDEAPRYIHDPGDKYQVKKHELSMIRYGDAGKVVRGLSGAIANNLFRINASDEFSLDYLFYLLSSPTAYSFLRQGNTSSTMPAISFKVVKRLMVTMPPMDEQIRIVTHLDALAESTRTLEAETQVRLDQLATLKSSLLDSAFRGQL